MASKVRNVTEFSYVTLKQGINVFDESAAAKTYQNVIDTVLRQPGARRVYTSLEVEDPSKLWLFLDWDTLEDHENYPKSADHGPIIESLQPLADFEKSMNKHVTLNPFPPEDVLDSASSPVTEVLVAFFPSDYSISSRAAATRRLEQFAAQALKASPDWRGISYGWSVENDVPIRGDEGNSGAMLVAFIGWPSLEAHQKFRETDDFKQNIGLLREMEGLLKLSTFHVSCVSKEAKGLEERDAKKAAENGYGHGHEHGCGSSGCC
jgi:heme-degrading monooxygenase HmoA